jgi:hypothetical protein
LDHGLVSFLFVTILVVDCLAIKETCSMFRFVFALVIMNAGAAMTASTQPRVPDPRLTPGVIFLDVTAGFQCAKFVADPAAQQGEGSALLGV